MMRRACLVHTANIGRYVAFSLGSTVDLFSLVSAVALFGLV